MPEMPEVHALVAFLAERTVGHAISRATITSFSALKTFDPPIDALDGATITGVTRLGKFIDIETDAAHLVFHLARAGWLRWFDAVPATAIKPGRSPIALRVRLDDGSGFDLTEAGSKKSLAVYVVRDPHEVPGIARLGPDALADDFTEAEFAEVLRGRRTQIKGLLRDQSIIAGIGNAYSDEILHVAKLSPFAIAATMPPETVAHLYDAMRTTLTDAAAIASGKPPAELKDAKRANMRVHARSGQPCPVCGDTVRDVNFHDSSLQYCPTCQTGGKVLADRILSRLLK
ncbi:MAG: DNA-formamidopyrimidine glycosylase family protein [Leifsonia flava]